MARYVPDPARRIAVFLGRPVSCGKSELSVHWALQAAAEGKNGVLLRSGSDEAPGALP